jgi:23S rRNA pseudouridine2605 synthase
MNDDRKKPRSPVTDGRSAESVTAEARGLARVITKAGYATRRQAEEMVRSGRVTVDGKRVLEPGFTVTRESVVAIDGHRLVQIVRTYLAFHKPDNVSAAPLLGRRARLITEYLPKDVPGLNPAGRLDVATTGLILVSNDSAWNSTAAGGAGIEKEYLIRFKGEVPDVQVDFLSAGIQVPKHGLVKPESVVIHSRDRLQTVLDVVVLGAKLRPIRTLCSTLRMDVQGVHRIRMGPVLLGDLKPGRYRYLLHDEVEEIRGCGA